MIDYVLGFAFNEDLSRLLLILKNKPDWQKGKLNGIGGKIESNEQPVQAMTREFEEESSIYVYPNEWTYFTRMIDNRTDASWRVWCFYAILPDTQFYLYKTTTDEAIVMTELSKFNPNNCIENLAWLIPLARAYAKKEISYKIII